VLGSLDVCPVGLTRASQQTPCLFFAEQAREKEGQQRRGNESVELPITTELVRFFANLAGNLSSFSAQDSEETGGNGLLVCS